ncbi:hypothetical protein X751_31645 [Mesorhizobium sp. LNJC395A00]|nr:hypothetical protein X751_31645 [Mesorhizobium sp. LNJC395A00]
MVTSSIFALGDALAGYTVVFAVNIGRRIMEIAGRAFNVDDAPHQRNGSAQVPAGTPQAFRF